jgi:transposase
MILVSSVAIPKIDVVQTYYLRQSVEMLFGFSKDDLGLLPLRVHSEDALRGFLFMQFLTLIAFMQLKQKLGNKLTVEGALVRMRNLKCKVYPKDLIVGELTKKQKEIIEKLDILMANNPGI